MLDAVQGQEGKGLIRLKDFMSRFKVLYQEKVQGGAEPWMAAALAEVGEAVLKRKIDFKVRRERKRERERERDRVRERQRRRQGCKYEIETQ